MKLYINKITKQEKFKLTNEVIIRCNIEELKKITSFFVDTLGNYSPSPIFFFVRENNCSKIRDF